MYPQAKKNEPQNSKYFFNELTHLKVTVLIVGVGRVQKIRVDYSQIKTRLDIESSRHLVSTITGNDIQYGGSRKQKNI